MEFRFASRVSSMKASAVREMLKLTAAKDVISFGGGLPPSECFPLDAIGAALQRIVSEQGARALQYSTTEGCPELRTMIAERMRRRLGVAYGADDVLVTTGSQQALDLTGKVFLDEGDVVFCESPTYLAAISAFRACRASFVVVPSDEQGMIVEELERLASGCEHGRLVYVIPDFQNPSGRTWSLARRKELLEVAARLELPVVEDAPYRELRFEGDELPALAALDRDGRVVFTSTFSKVLCPGLRIGWVAAPGPALEKYVLAKQAADLHTSTLAQLLVSAFMEEQDVDRHIASIRSVCRERRDAMLRAADEWLPREVRVSRPGGGLFLWLELPLGLETREWLQRCLAHGVAFVPGDAFCPNGGGENAARICFSGSPEAQIVEGVRRMAVALREMSGAERLSWPETMAA
jgi:2-aminoadipate transaminase